MTTKLTDRKIYEAIMDGKLDTLDTDAIAAWAEKKIAQLDHKAEKAKEIAARKRSEGDELAAAVMAAVGDEFEMIADIAARIDGDGRWQSGFNPHFRPVCQSHCLVLSPLFCHVGCYEAHS